MDIHLEKNQKLTDEDVSDLETTDQEIMGDYKFSADDEYENTQDEENENEKKEPNVEKCQKEHENEIVLNHTITSKNEGAVKENEHEEIIGKKKGS